MKTGAELYRNASRRLHRMIANYFAMRAWAAGADCIVLDRQIIEPLLDLEQIKKKRIEWIQEDVNPWFPYVESINNENTDSVRAIYLSRVPIDKQMREDLSNAIRFKKTMKTGIKAIIFDGDTKVPRAEEEILAASTLWANGLQPPPSKVEPDEVVAPTPRFVPVFPTKARRI